MPAGAIAASIASRLLMVCVTTSIGFLARSPRAREHHIGIRGTVAMTAARMARGARHEPLLLSVGRPRVRPDPEARPTGAIPIILAHGYFSNRGYFRALVRGARSARRGTDLHAQPSPRPSPPSRTTPKSCTCEIERIAAATGRPQVILICHSMGGLGARAYLCAHGSSRVRKLVTIGSPHNGTVHARFGAGPNAKQMHRGSRFLEELCAKEGERGPECGVTSIYTPHDNLVAPQDSSRLPWARNIADPRPRPRRHPRLERLVAVLVKELRECGVAVSD